MNSSYESLFKMTITALAEIDSELGIAEDGCNSTERTLTAIKLLKSVHTDDQAEIAKLRAQIKNLMKV